MDRKEQIKKPNWFRRHFVITIILTVLITAPITYVCFAAFEIYYLFIDSHDRFFELEYYLKDSAAESPDSIMNFRLTSLNRVTILSIGKNGAFHNDRIIYQTNGWDDLPVNMLYREPDTIIGYKFGCSRKIYGTNQDIFKIIDAGDLIDSWGSFLETYKTPNTRYSISSGRKGLSICDHDGNPIDLKHK